MSVTSTKNTALGMNVLHFEAGATTCMFEVGVHLLYGVPNGFVGRSLLNQLMRAMKKLGIESNCEPATKQIVKDWLRNNPVYNMKHFETEWSAIRYTRVTLSRIVKKLRAKRVSVHGLDAHILNTIEHQPACFPSKFVTNRKAKQLQAQAVACYCARMLSAPSSSSINHPILAANNISALLKAYHIDTPGQEEVLAIPITGCAGVFEGALQSLCLLRLNRDVEMLGEECKNGCLLTMRRKNVKFF